MKKRSNAKLGGWSPRSLVEHLSFFEEILDPEDIFPETESIYKNLGNLVYKSAQKLRPIVLVISRLSSDYSPGNSMTTKLYLFLKDFSKLLLKKFSVSENNTVIIILSTGDKHGNILITKKHRKNLTKEKVFKILSSVEPELTRGDYVSAVNKIIDQLVDFLKKESGIKIGLLIRILVPFTIITLICVLWCLFAGKVKKEEKETVEKIEKKYTPLTLEETLKKFNEINLIERTSEQLSHEMWIICLNRLNKTHDDRHIKGKEKVTETSETSCPDFGQSQLPTESATFQ
jgi:hypothetical protein